MCGRPMMSFEERRVRRLLARNTLLFFVTFAVLFSLFGVLIFQMVSSSIYRSADDQLAELRILTSSATLDWASEDGGGGYEVLSDGNLSAEAKGAGAGLEEAMADSASDGGITILSRTYVASNPQLIYLWRSADGKAVGTEGFYSSYPAYFDDIPFEVGDLDRVYEVRAGGHAYRGINYAMGSGGAAEGEVSNRAYLQVLVNVDSEIALLEHFTQVLVVYLAVAVAVAAAVSFLLSHRTVKPIVASMNRQTEFVQNASHELRTPLAIILAAQERLLAEPGARIVDRFEDVGAVADETKRLARLVDDLMTLTSVDASAEDECEAAPVEVSGLVEDVGSLYADVAEVAGKMLTVAALPAGEAHIEADALRQVLGILLDNALKYTEEGDAVIVSCEERGGRVVLSVTDTGCGICPADRERVFERFYRADAARTTPGSGLGLSIARALVERARGTIVVETNEPRGTRITVTLPKARAHLHRSLLPLSTVAFGHRRKNDAAQGGVARNRWCPNRMSKRTSNGYPFETLYTENGTPILMLEHGFGLVVSLKAS